MTVMERNLQGARDAVNDLARNAPTLHGEELEHAIGLALLPYLSDQPTPNECTLCGIAVMALARLIEHERGERSTAA